LNAADGTVEGGGLAGRDGCDEVEGLRPGGAGYDMMNDGR
jgi:hypothetical protein